MKNITDINTSGLLRGGTTHLNLMRALVVLVMTMLLGLALPHAQANNGIAAGLLKVEQIGGTANTNTYVTPQLLINGFLPIKGDNWTITIPGVSTNSFPCWNRADYYLQIGESKLEDVNGGVLIPSVAQNGSWNTNNSGVGYLGYAISAFEANSAGTYRIVTSSTNLTPVKGEWNTSVAGAWFP